ncbi:putative short-chain oxidoreductase [Marasmius fiardii PR-910]|nr:putative short-chain oxidoreductase [Marasmius fiardii PR-910]
MPPLVWLITGTSSGLGKRLVKSVLNRGDYVIATARHLAKIESPDIFPASERLKLLELDLSWDLPRMERAIESAIGFQGRIDVLVNNAGWALKFLVEDCGVDEFKEQFDCNFFGVVRLTNLVFPGMRERREGCVVMVGSRSSWLSELPATALYNSSKAALRVYSETLASELAQFSVKILIVEPGALRTEGIVSARPYIPLGDIPEYQDMRDKVDTYYRDEVDGKQRGDPVKVAEVMVDVVKGEGEAVGRPWPLYLPLGVDSMEAMKNKCQRLLNTIEDWKDILTSTDHDDYQPGI